jgi:hypothetical protein
LVIVAAIESSSLFFLLRGRRSNFVPTCANASIDAAPKEPAAVNLAASSSVCQWKNPCFHRFFAVFFGFYLEKADFKRFL